MPDNYDISDILTQYARLYELHGGNPFKVKSIASAAYNIKKLGEQLEKLSHGQLEQIPQIGKSILPKVLEIIETGSFAELEELLENTPKGVQDMLRVKGLGPKKVEVLWKQVGIASIPELLDACRENRLVEIKGFGYKTQAQIQSDIEFKFSNEGKFHWARIEPVVMFLNELFEHEPSVQRYEAAGEFRRLCEVVNSLDYVVICRDFESLCLNISTGGNFEYNGQMDEGGYQLIYSDALRVRLFPATFENWGNVLLEKTSTPEHLEKINYDAAIVYGEEEEVYKALKLPVFLPELREGLYELDRAERMDRLINYRDLKGVLHNHTTYSDGLHSVEEMAREAHLSGFEYIGICDHSQTAGYANGLKPERVIQQMKEIDLLNEKLAPFRIFKGIESDILGDGSLDYTEDILRMFDLVVASIHSNLAMDEEKAMKRLVRAIENPYTNILGHPTGRLLLMRPGYPVKHEMIIDACAANGVAIELNAHPYRLDLDWRWIDYAVNKGVPVSINPDAHQKEGLGDMRYGVQVARKGYLCPENCLNARNMEDFTKWLELKRRAVK